MQRAAPGLACQHLNILNRVTTSSPRMKTGRVLHQQLHVLLPNGVEATYINNHSAWAYKYCRVCCGQCDVQHCLTALRAPRALHVAVATARHQAGGAPLRPSPAHQRNQAPAVPSRRCQ